METILVTGASGFIGRNICDHFSTKYNVLSPTHKDLNLLLPNTVKEYFRKNQVDHIINCAAVGMTKQYNVTDIVEKNVRMYLNLKHYGRYNKMIQIGSGAEYDKSNNLHKVHETSFGASIPQDPYGLSKYVIGREVKTDIHGVNLRLFGVFGKYEDVQYKFISNAILKNIIGIPITIRQNVMFDWLYINDLMQVIEYYIKGIAFHSEYNVTPTESIDLVSIAKLINKLSGKEVPVRIEKPGMNLEYTGSNTRLLTEMRELKFTPMETAISELVTTYTKNITDNDQDYHEWLRFT